MLLSQYEVLFKIKQDAGAISSVLFHIKYATTFTCSI